MNKNQNQKSVNKNSPEKTNKKISSNNTNNNISNNHETQSSDQIVNRLLALNRECPLTSFSLHAMTLSNPNHQDHVTFKETDQISFFTNAVGSYFRLTKEGADQLDKVARAFERDFWENRGDDDSNKYSDVVEFISAPKKTVKDSEKEDQGEEIKEKNKKGKPQKSELSRKRKRSVEKDEEKN
jgi:hypothetical protein